MSARRSNHTYYTRGPDGVDRDTWSVATDSEDDPCIRVQDCGDGGRTYWYSGSPTPVTAAHRRAAAAAIAAYQRSRAEVRS